MALFGRERDINLFHTINSELLKDIIQTEVAYYKFALEQTTINVYGESMGKVYYEPMKIACLIDRQDQAWSSDDFGSDVNQSVGFNFLKNELRALKGVTIVTIITPEDYVQKTGSSDEYIRLRIKFVTRGESKEMLQNFLDAALAKDDKDTIRIQGVKSMKYREGTLKRL